MLESMLSDSKPTSSLQILSQILPLGNDPGALIEADPSLISILMSSTANPTCKTTNKVAIS